MPVIAVVGNKGGAGKTTLSVNLAAGLGQQLRTAVVDADPQGSALQWRTISAQDGAFPVYRADSDITGQANDLQRDFDYIVIDCPPSVHAPQTGSALKVCDVAMIPVQPSPMDLWATVHIERAIENAYKNNPRLKALLVINQLEARTTLSRLMREALAEIALPVANTAVRRRAVYRNSVLEGKSVYDLGRRGAGAAEELDHLIREVMIHDEH